MARQFYDGYPKIYDRKKEVTEKFCDDALNAREVFECEPCKNDVRRKENIGINENCEKESCKKESCKKENRKNESCKCENKNCKCEKNSACECENQSEICAISQNNCCPPPKACSNGILDGIFENFAADDIILLGIALLLLHDGTNDTLLLVIIAIIFLEGIT